VIAPAVRPLPESFATWLRLRTDAELLALLDVVREALERQGYVVAVAAKKIPRAA